MADLRVLRPGSGLRVRQLACAALVAGGLAIAHGSASATPGRTPSAGTSAPGTTLMIGTPCAVTARACVDLTSQKAWLFKDNAIERGPVDITSGGPGEETPTGNFTVAWKDRNHINAELTPMPYSVFFAAGGVAFHGGSLQRQSAGCVHLGTDDSIIFYDSLAIGAAVQVRGVAPLKDTSGSGNGRSRSRGDRRNGPDVPSNGPTSRDGSLLPAPDDAPPASDSGSGSLIAPGRPQPAGRNRGSGSSSQPASDDPLGPTVG